MSDTPCENCKSAGAPLPGKGVSDYCQGCGYCTSTRGAASPEAQSELLVRDVVRRVVARIVGATSQGAGIPIGVSVRHVHITREHLDALYGPGYQLNRQSELYQPGEFAAQETVTLVGPRLRSLQNVRLLYPVRSYTQVELSRTDGVLLGLRLPMRDSGDLKGTEPVVLVGPAGSVALQQGAIRAMRHIHINPADAQRLGVLHGQLVSIEVPGTEGLIFRNVKIRVGEKSRLQMHIDTDDANAAGIVCNREAYICK